MAGNVIHGSGYGSGYGYGYGSGYGYGYGPGYGDGSGDGYVIGQVGGGIDVLLLAPWPVVKVGCKTKALDDWRETWREVAEREGVSIGEPEVERLIEEARRILDAAVCPSIPVRGARR